MTSAATTFQTRLKQAVDLIGRNDLDRARDALSALLAEAPNHPDLLQLLGVVHRRAGRPQEAIAHFKASLARMEKQPHVHNNLGATLAAAGQREEAEKHYRRALALKSDYTDAKYNLALLQLESNPAESKALLDAAVRENPANSSAFDALGLALGKLGDHQAAMAAATRATALAPTSHTAQHNLGQAATAAVDHAVAERAYRAAIELKPSSDASWIGLGNTLRLLERNEEAVTAFERAVAANPSNADAHRLLNEMLWQTGRADRYLASYPTAIAARPSDTALRVSYANELLRAGQAAEALKELAVAAKAAPDDARLNNIFARAWSMSGDFDRAVAHHRRATEKSPQTASLTQDFLETLLKAGRFDEAIDLSSAAVEKFVFDQGIMALHTTALQIQGDKRHAWLADFANIAKVSSIEPPEGFSDIVAFNAALAEELRRLHATKNHPTDQTLRGGTQTFGALFQRHEPLIGQLRIQIEKAVRKFIAEMPDDPAHPFFARKSASFRFSGSWSVRLHEGGFHTNHVHPEGWISSAYYIALPPAHGESEPNPGWFKMGETNLQLGAHEKIQRLVRPEVGHLVLFPSYFWHGTIPFHSPSERLTVAFDVVPV